MQLPKPAQISLVALLLLSASQLVAAEITIRLDAVDTSQAADLTVTALRFNADYPRFEKADTEWKHPSPGIWKTDLPEGGYAFEIAGTLNGETVFARSQPTRVSSKPIDWQASLHRQHIEFIHRGEPLGLRHLSVRSHDVRGETIVHDGSPIDRVTLLTTAGTQLDTTLVADDVDTIALGYALIKSDHRRLSSTEHANAPELLATITASGRGWFERPVLLSPVNPPIRSGKLTLVYPRGELDVDYREGIEVVTNRDLFHLGYELISEAGRRLVSRKCFVRVDKIDRFVLGGKLQPSSFAKILTKLPSEKQYRVAGLLCDPSGIEINVHKSSIDWKEDFKLRGKEPLPKNPLDVVELGLLGDPTQTVRIGVSWNWNRPRTVQLKPEPFTTFSSGHFVVPAPPAWRDRAEIYLHQLEHCHEILQRTTGRRGPKKTNIRWRLNTHNAKARVGGKQSWMSMPLYGLYQAEDPFGRPWFMVHEMLHTFGYHHGGPMTTQTNLGRTELALTRWWIPTHLYNENHVKLSLINKAHAR